MLDGGAEIDAEVVVFSAGIRPRDELARGCGLPVGERGGIVVDDSCRTEDPAVWAIGECALVGGAVHGLVGPCFSMAEVVADRLLSDTSTAVFEGADMSTKLKLMGVDVASFGDPFAGPEQGALGVTYTDPVAGVYKEAPGQRRRADPARRRPRRRRRVVRDPARLRRRQPARRARADAVRRDRDRGRRPARRHRHLLLQQRHRRGHPLRDRRPLPHRRPRRQGLHPRRDELRQLRPLVKRILDAELTAAGIEVSKALCEHFDYSRAELFDIVRAGQVTSFTQLVEEHGTGRGCDICKPAVASILASLGNGHILEGEQAALQDTNDHFLANLQKNGTYSVVPRVPGGEITPRSSS